MHADLPKTNEVVGWGKKIIILEHETKPVCKHFIVTQQHTTHADLPKMNEAIGWGRKKKFLSMKLSQYYWQPFHITGLISSVFNKEHELRLIQHSLLNYKK